MSRHVVAMTIDDVDHYTAEERERIVASYPPHEREARAKGIPSMGSGRVFPVTESTIVVPRRPIPPQWYQIGGMDFGIDHPFAAVNLCWDKDYDCLYVARTYRVKGAIPALHATALRPWGEWIPWAWPHDGLIRDKGSGDQLKDIYKAHHLNMLPEQASHAEGGNGVEAGIIEMHERMETGRFKVFDDCSEWLEEFRMYHRKDGIIVKERDDLMSATRYAVMMKRYAALKPTGQHQRHKVKIGIV